MTDFKILAGLNPFGELRFPYFTELSRKFSWRAPKQLVQRPNRAGGLRV